MNRYWRDQLALWGVGIAIAVVVAATVSILHYSHDVDPDEYSYQTLGHSDVLRLEDRSRAILHDIIRTRSQLMDAESDVTVDGLIEKMADLRKELNRIRGNQAPADWNYSAKARASVYVICDGDPECIRATMAD